MASFCNKCGAPVSGVFCVKCGFDTRQAAGPPPQPAEVIVPPAPPSPTPSISPVAAAGVGRRLPNSVTSAESLRAGPRSAISVERIFGKPQSRHPNHPPLSRPSQLFLKPRPRVAP